MLVKMSDMFGGNGGREFVTHLHTHGEQISEIRVAAGDFVDGLQIVFTNALGQPDELPIVGGDGGTRADFVLDEDEYLVGISGRYGDFIDQIQFHTNKRVSPVYGGSGGDVFSLYAAEGEEVAGFFGRAGWFIDAIGIATRPIEKPEAAPSMAEKATGAMTAALGFVQEKVAEAQGKVVEKVAEVQEKAAEVVEKVTREAKPKDLQKIEGIGPKISQILVAKGIVDLTALAETGVEQLQAILKDAGSRYKLADPTTWPEQAKIGADEGMKALKAFQATLKGGRKKK